MRAKKSAVVRNLEREGNKEGGTMPWCAYCAKDQIAEQDDINGFT